MFLPESIHIRLRMRAAFEIDLSPRPSYVMLFFGTERVLQVMRRTICPVWTATLWLMVFLAPFLQYSRESSLKKNTWAVPNGLMAVMWTPIPCPPGRFHSDGGGLSSLLKCDAQASLADVDSFWHSHYSCFEASIRTGIGNSLLTT